MAKRVTKPTTSAKQTAATRRTKKTTTPTKKTPTKKAPIKKTATKSDTKKPATKASGKKTATKSATTKKTATPKKRTVKSGKNPTTKTTFSALEKEKAAILAKIKNKKPKATAKKNKSKEFYRIPENAPQVKFNEMGEKVRLGEVKWAYYATDNGLGYHHYEKLK